MRNDVATGAVFEDATIYEMDNKFFGAPPPPRYSQETIVGSTFHYHHQDWIPINGFVGLRNFNGSFSLPSELAIIQRNTFDTIFDAGVTPTLRWGNAHFILNPGIEFTIRRDTQSPVQMDQNLFRQYLYLNTSPLFHWITIRGTAIHEAGPFTEQNMSSRDLGALLEFEVGRPWGHDAFITGYSVRNLLFHPQPHEFFTTATWGGLQHKFGQTAIVTGLVSYVRSWRVQGNEFATAQILVPGVKVQVKPRERWTISGALALTRGEGFSLYNNAQSGILISYVRPMRRSIHDGNGVLAVDYPLSLAFGFEQQNFYNFTGNVRTNTFRPVIKISIF
jgi:hypothetical protein